MNPPVTQDTLVHLLPISGLGPEGLSQATQLAQQASYPRGSQLEDFVWARQVVFLLKGELKLDFPDGCMKVMVGGRDDTMAPLTYGGALPVGAKAITDVTLLWFDENALDILVTWDQLVPATGAEADWRTMPGLFDAHKLASGTFASLPPAHIESLFASFRRQSVRLGEVIVRQNEPGDFYYVIERGRAVVSREVAGARMELAELNPGDTFGEEALIAETARNATVTMKTDGELLRLDSADFVRLLREPLLQKVSAAEAARRVAAGACWLDVRFPAEYRQDGLPGALNIPLNELRDALPNLRRDVEYIVYCQTGRRSSAATFLLSQRGVRASLLDDGLKSMDPAGKVAA